MKIELTFILNVSHLHHFPADIDECTLGTDDCSENAICDNIDGFYTCTCNDGYDGDGVQCSGNYVYIINNIVTVVTEAKRNTVLCTA